MASPGASPQGGAGTGCVWWPGRSRAKEDSSFRSSHSCLGIRQFIEGRETELTEGKA
jgi:hypothetical protein